MARDFDIPIIGAPRGEMRIPVLGAAMVAHDGNLQVTLTCKCKDDNAPLLIPATNAIAQCRSCGNGYVIVSALFRRDRGDQAVGVRIAQLPRQQVAAQGEAQAVPDMQEAGPGPKPAVEVRRVDE